MLFVLWQTHVTVYQDAIFINWQEVILILLSKYLYGQEVQTFKTKIATNKCEHELHVKNIS